MTTEAKTKTPMFNPQWNYNANEIAAIAGIPLEAVQLAAERREISCVCVVCRDGSRKAWKGDKCEAWVKRWIAENRIAENGNTRK